MIGAGVGAGWLSAWGGVRLPPVPQIITATELPTLALITSDDPPVDGYTAGAFQSSEGAIVSAVESWAGGDQTVAQPSGTTMSVSVLVTDDQGNQRTFQASRTVVDVAVTATPLPFLSPATAGDTPAGVINGTGLGSVTPVADVAVSDFQDADVNNNFALSILQGSGAAITRIEDTARGGGNFAAMFAAGPEDSGTVGKALLSYHPADYIYPGATVTAEFDLFLPNASGADWDGQKFFDIENNLVANSPGLRMTMYANGGNVGLTYERGKIGEPIMAPSVINQALALETWHRVRTAVTLGDATTGRARIWLDDVLVLDEVGATLMTQAIWDANGGSGAIQEGVNSLQFGATANNDSANSAIVLMDNIVYGYDNAYSVNHGATLGTPNAIFTTDDFVGTVLGNVALAENDVLDARKTVPYTTALGNPGEQVFDMDAVVVAAAAPILSAARSIPPISLRQGSGNWTFPLFQEMPYTATAKTYSLTNGSAFASVDANTGVVMVSSTDLQDDALLTLQAAAGGETYTHDYRVVVEAMPAPDHTFATQAEFDALTIAAGDIVEVTARINEKLVIDGLSDLILRSANQAASIEGLQLLNTIDGFSGRHLSVEARIWPSREGQSLDFAGAAVSNLRLEKSRIIGLYEGTTFWDPSDRTLPIYDNHRFSGTATTTPQTFDIPWDAFAETDITTTALLYRRSGTGELRFEFLDATDTPVTVEWDNGGQSGTVRTVNTTYTSSNPDAMNYPNGRPAKIRVSTTSGTAEFGAKVYQNVPLYMPDFMGRSSTSSLNNITVSECFVSGWNNFAKPQTGNQGLTEVIRCGIMATYQDVMAMNASAGSTFRLAMNAIQQPFYHRTGLAWEDDADPGDPHGDIWQIFSTNNNPLVEFVEAWGNVTLATGLRGYDDQKGQGFVFTQVGGDNNPQYSRIVTVANFIQGVNNGVGATAVAAYTAHNVGHQVHSPSDTVSIGFKGASDFDPQSMGVGFGNVSGDVEEDQDGISVGFNNLQTANEAAFNAAFADYDAALVANNWEAMSAALTPAVAGPAEGMGPTAGDFVDFDAGALNWANLPVGIGFAQQVNIEPDTLTETETRVVLVGDVTRTLTPDTGVEWRWAVLGADITLEAWLSGADDVDAAVGDMAVRIQLRYTSAATEFTVESHGLQMGGQSIGGARFQTRQLSDTIFDASNISIDDFTENGGTQFAKTPNDLTITNPGGGVCRIAFSAEGEGMIVGDDYVAIYAIASTDAAQPDIRANVAANTGFTSDRTDATASGISTEIGNPTIIEVPFTYGGTNHIMGFNTTLADGETITLLMAEYKLQTKYYYDNPPQSSLVDFPAIPIGSMDKNHKVAFSDVAGGRQLVINGTGIAFASYPLTGLESGTTYTATMPMSGDVSQTVNARVCDNNSGLSAAILDSDDNFVVGTDAGNPASASLTFTATANTMHIGFRTSVIAVGTMLFHDADWVIEQV